MLLTHQRRVRSWRWVCGTNRSGWNSEQILCTKNKQKRFCFTIDFIISKPFTTLSKALSWYKSVQWIIMPKYLDAFRNTLYREVVQWKLFKMKIDMNTPLSNMYYWRKFKIQILRCSNLSLISNHNIPIILFKIFWKKPEKIEKLKWKNNVKSVKTILDKYDFFSILYIISTSVDKNWKELLSFVFINLTPKMIRKIL